MSSISIAEYKTKYTKTKPRGQKTKRRKANSPGEEKLAIQLKALKIKFEREFKFCTGRKWRADFALRDDKILIEVEGGIWSNGRHTRAKGYIADLEKYNMAQKLGYKVFRFSTEQVMSGAAIQQIEQVVEHLK
ncbi:MAG: DUF559 domain-containing protein [Acinetobacter sp.]